MLEAYKFKIALDYFSSTYTPNKNAKYVKLAMSPFKEKKTFFLTVKFRLPLSSLKKIKNLIKKLCREDSGRVWWTGAVLTETLQGYWSRQEDGKQTNHSGGGVGRPIEKTFFRHLFFLFFEESRITVAAFPKAIRWVL